MDKLWNQTLGMKFFSPEPEGGGGTDPIKFGGVEIDLNADPEVLKAAIIKAQGAYNDSSTAGIKAAKDLKAKGIEFEALKASKANEQPSGAGLSKDEINKIFDERMGAVNEIAAKGKKFNMDREIEKSNADLRKEFSYLDDETFNEAMKGVDITFKNQDISRRSGAMHKNIAEVALGKAMRKNINDIDSKVAMDKIMKDPEVAIKFITEYSKQAGIDINLPEGGFTDQSSFETKIETLQKEFKAEKDPNKRGRIVQKIADTQSEGNKYGFKL